MKIVRLDSKMFPPAPEETAGYRALGLEVVETGVKTPEEIAKVCSDADYVTVVADYIKRDVIEQMQCCKAILKRGTGTDKIDIPYATERGIIVTNLPVYAISSLAEHAIMLMLALARQLPWYDDAVNQCDWIGARARNAPNCFRLEGKTLGIVGLGNIGKAIATRMRGFGMKILTYHRRPEPDEEQKYGAKPVALDDLVEQSDIIIVVCSYTDETRNLISRERIAKMKPSVYLINIARGGVCDEQALAEALAAHKIAGAGIDVFEHINVHQPPEGQKKNYYEGLDNIIMTPHCAALCPETTMEGVEKLLGQLTMLVEGVFPSSVANPSVYEKVKDRYKLIESSTKPV